jgi:4-amino-4-deoxy-L-arabinose transferase-like glycosyltransferase
MEAGQIEDAEYKAVVFPWLILILATLVCLIPFSNKAFHIDDTLFVWAAKHIQSHPENPYGFAVNWYGSEMPMSDVMKNPPLNSYFIAGAASLVGWSERSLHLAFLIPAIAIILGTYRLAGFFCKKPLFAALLTLFSPAFLVSGTAVMCDVSMLAFWIWAVVLWVKGIEKDSPWRLILATILIALSALTKYYGMSLIPLLAIYAIMKKRGLGWWIAYLLIPAAVLAWYQFATYNLYGRGLLLDAGEYAVATREGYGAAVLPKTLVGLSFIGGCFLSVLAYSYFLWSKTRIVFGAIFSVILLLILSSIGTIGGYSLLNAGGGTKWLTTAQLCIFIVVGIGLADLAATEVYRRRDADSILLFLWVIGTFAFAAYINWTVNVRSILPLLPAASILLMRRLEDSFQPSKLKPNQKKRKKDPVEPTTFLPEWGRLIFPIIPLALLALMVAYADFELAGSARTAAEQIRKQYNKNYIFFEGHWGFQYYMESLNGKAINFQNAGDIASSDILVRPVNNTNVSATPIPKEIATPLPELKFNAVRWLSTMNVSIGAGFYADLWGPLPYAFGAVPPERYMLSQVNSPR